MVTPLSNARCVGRTLTANGQAKKFVELRHDNFMAKVVSVLGEDLLPKFLGSNEFTNGKGGVQTQSIYIFPKREATLMAMSYSAAISAAVYDRMTDLEELTSFSRRAPKSRAARVEQL